MQQEEHNTWCVSHHVKPVSDSEKKKIPSSIGIKSLKCFYTNFALSCKTVRYAIHMYEKLPGYTEKKCELPYVPLRSDQGMHRIAKEIQLLKLDRFDNILLELVGFHTEKVVLTSIGKLLEGG